MIKNSKIKRVKVVPQRNKNDEIIHTQASLNTIRWKTEVCSQGEICWCRMIVPKKPQKDSEGVDIYIIGSGSVPKENAEHIVTAHNLLLDISGMPMDEAKKIVKSRLKNKNKLKNKKIESLDKCIDRKLKDSLGENYI